MLAYPFRLPRDLARFHRQAPSLDQAVADLRAELTTREPRFLEIVRTLVMGVRGSPYRRLFDHAGVTLDELAEVLRRRGLEETLTTLATEGVYLTPDEFKGRVPVERGSLRFRIRAKDLIPHAAERARPTLLSQTSGSTGAPTRSATSLAWQIAETPALAAFVRAHGLDRMRLAAYEPVLAGVAAGIHTVNTMVRLGVPLTRWFARPAPVRSPLERLYFRITAAQIAHAGRRWGAGFASPEPVPADELVRIGRWVAAERAAGHLTCIRTVASNAARIARECSARGVSLEGCTFIASGEPVTRAKRRVVEEAGGRVIVLWGYEPGAVHVGLGCAAPEHGDEMHVVGHSLAAIEHPTQTIELGDRDLRPLLFTTLYQSAAIVRINVSNGDFATLTRRDCGCGLQTAGLGLHAHAVGSFEKLTSEGLAYPFTQLFELLETRLPDTFGGGPGDYQLVEEEGDRGRTHLTLRVAPSVGALDEEALRSTLVAELARGSRGNRFAADTWSSEGTIRVRREAPEASGRGKVLPLRVSPRRSE